MITGTDWPLFIIYQENFFSALSSTMNTFAIVRNTVDIFKIDWELDFLKDEERKAYYDAFSAFDWNNNGKISTGALIFAMRRAGRADCGCAYFSVL